MKFRTQLLQIKHVVKLLIQVSRYLRLGRDQNHNRLSSSPYQKCNLCSFLGFFCVSAGAPPRPLTRFCFWFQLYFVTSILRLYSVLVFPENSFFNFLVFFFHQCWCSHLDRWLVFVFDFSFCMSRVSCVCTPSSFSATTLKVCTSFLGFVFLRFVPALIKHDRQLWDAFRNSLCQKIRLYGAL